MHLRPVHEPPVLELVPEPATDRAIAGLAQIVVDVLTGQRSADQLIGHATTEVLAQVRRAVGTRAAAARLPPAGRDPRPAARERRDRQTVASTHIQRPAPGVVEAAVVVRGGRRSGALAIRLEWRESRWRCTVIEARQ